MRRTIRAGAWAGAVGALVMILSQAIARLGAGVPMFPDLLEDAFTRDIPAVIFSGVLDTLKFQAKPLLFVGILVLQVVVGAAIGIVYALLTGSERPGARRPWPGWSHAFRCALVTWLIVDVVVLPLAGDGFFGGATSVGAIALNVALLIVFFLFGLSLAGTYRVSIARLPEEAAEGAAPSPERRRLLGGFAVGAIAVLAAGATYRVVTAESGATLTVVPTPIAGSGSGAPTPASAPSPAAATPVAPPVAGVEPGWQVPGLPPEVTPTKDFYVVSKNFFSDPVLDPARWTLEIVGLVKKPYTMTYNQLLKLPFQDRYQTLECISNEIGGDLISNGSWRGVSLHDLIAAAGPDPKTVKVAFTAADGYTDSVPFERAMSPANLLAYLMNGVPLEPGHGAPARLLVPGIFGMKNVKWLTRIELLGNDFSGYWEQRGWSDQAVVQTMSEFNSASTEHSSVPAGKLELAGVAFAGDRGISKVEVSVDNGKTWQAATLKDPLGPYTWRLWRLDWNATPGQYTVIVRATDGAGQVQTSKATDTLPNGATGWDSRALTVK
ncbi:MAG: molybdopterin-dependent oxidoreductase [Chloroflexota bacterium]